MYNFLDHKSDQLVEVTANSIEELFEDSAKAFFDTIVTISKVEPKVEYKLSITGKTPQDLLYNFLNELLYIFDVNHLVFSKFEITIDGDTAYVKMYGEKFSETQGPKHEIKAVTWHNFEVGKVGNIWHARFLFDL